MDSKKNIKNEVKTASDIPEILKQMDRDTRYLLYEKDRGHGKVCREFVRFDERFIRSPISVEEMINRKNKRVALFKALSEMSGEENEIISECFFDNIKVNYTKLGRKHGITGQAYKKRLDRVLIKLKKLVISYYEEY